MFVGACNDVSSPFTSPSAAPSSEKEGSGVSASDCDDSVRLAGRWPSDRSEASEAGRPAA